MATLKSRATGYIGSRYVGIPAATNWTEGSALPPALSAPSAAPTQATGGAPKVVGSQGKNPGEWIGSTYIGPAAPPPIPPSPPKPDLGPYADDFTPRNPDGSKVDPQLGQIPGFDYHTMMGVAPPEGEAAPPPAPAGQPRGAMEGFDFGKLADPTKGTSHKYVGGRILQGGGGVDQVLADPMFQGWSKVSDDKIKSPEGTVYDLFRDQEGANAPQWTRIGGTGQGLLNDGIKGNANGGGGGTTQFTIDDFGPANQPDPWQGYGLGQYPDPGTVNNEYDPLGDATNDALMYLLEGRETPLENAANSKLTQRIQGGGEDNFNKRFESITERINKGRRGQQRNAQAILADRGILGEPGHVSGPEINAYRNIENDIAPEYAQAIRDALADASDQDLSYLQLAQDAAQNQKGTLLSSIGAATGRQTALAQVALASLAQNMEWNKFLAEFGLDRERVMMEMENGNIDRLLPLIQLFAQVAGRTQEGSV